MNAMVRSALALGVGLVGLGLWGAPSAVAKSPPIYTASKAALALEGYDAVSYFAGAAPVKGAKAIAITYKGATWQFANEANLEAFQAQPDLYVPQYGGYCAWAVSKGATAAGDPTVYKLVGGKLYLNISRSVATTWERDIAGNIAKADGHWPKVLEP
jgi:YHS domain-containing protein